MSRRARTKDRRQASREPQSSSAEFITPQSIHPEREQFVRLQKTVGNRAVQRLVRSGSLARNGRGMGQVVSPHGPGSQLSAPTVLRAAGQAAGNQPLAPVLGQSAITTLGRHLPSMKSRHGRVIDFSHFENELQLGSMMSRLLNFQPSYKRKAVKQYIDSEKKRGWEHLRFPGTTIDGKTPQQWYRKINRNRRIPAGEKQILQTVVYAAYHLRAVRNAIRQNMTSKQRVAHGQAPLSGNYGNVILFRVLVEELASRLPRNLSFNENRLGKYLLQIIGNRLTAANVPYYLNPPAVKPNQTLTFRQLLHQINSRWLLYRFLKSSKGKLEQWAETASVASLIFSIQSAKDQFPNHWEKTLRAREITPSQLGGLLADERKRIAGRSQ